MAKRPAAIALFLAGFVLFSGSIKHELRRPGEGRGADSVKVGEVAPDFSLRGVDGGDYGLNDVAAASSVVIINFWGAWCAPCRLEMPQLEKAYARHRDSGLVILAVNEKDERPALDEYLAKRPLSFPVLIDSGEAVAARYGIRAYPTTVVVAPDGRVTHVFQGLIPHLESQLSSIVARANRTRSREAP